VSDRVFLTMPQVVERYAGAFSRYTLYELTRTGRVPHRKLPGCRGLLFPLDELERWEDGAQLEHVQLPDGGRVVRPVQNGTGS
jgi:hypothetical protein